MAGKNFYSVADRMAATGGHASGFDYMRLSLSLSIVLLHSVVTGSGAAADVEMSVGPLRPLVRMILPMFFALSGFLVAGSLERSRTLGMFMGLRAIRIYPALIVEVFLSAFLLGPLVTTLSTTAYFSDPLFFRYLLNALGDVHFSLPGVFLSNPLPNVVNGQLWTIPFELYCYCTLAVLTIIGIKRWRIIGPASVLLVTIAYLCVTLYRHNGEIVPVTGAINGALLVASFLAGVSIYLYRDILPWNPALGISSIIVAMVLLAYVRFGDFFAPAIAAYATVYLGLQNPNRKMLRGADYSYGIYLYGFAIQQTIVDLFPPARIWYINMLISVPCVVLVSAMSWHLVEKPAGKLRFKLKELEDHFLNSRFGRRFAASSETLSRS